MRHVRRGSAWLLLLALVALAGPSWASEADAVDAKAIDTVFREAWPAAGPGGAAIVMRGDDQLYRGAYGMAEIELGVMLEPDMVFRLGSITKQFTAAAILLLAEQGKLALDDPITRFLPDYPMQGHTITVEHLLTHTSGIASYTGIPGYMDDGVRRDLSVEELIDVFRDLPMEFAPGERFSYSNSGYVLLGAIVEQASGTDYATFVRTRLFEPHGMEHSYYGGPQIIPRRVAGYEGGGDGLRNASFLSMSQPYAAGSLLSNVDDLARWNRALFAGEVVGKQWLEKMIRPYVLSDGEESSYGYGLMNTSLRGTPVVGHGGGINGFRTMEMYLPEERVYVAVLQNSSTVGDPQALANRAAAIAIGRPFRTFREVALPEDELAAYVGVYRIDDETERVVTRADGSLYTQRTGGPRLPLHAAADDEFFYEGSLTWLRFVRDDEGRVTGMEVFQDGADEPEPAERVSIETPPPVVVLVADLGEYTGTYELAPGFVFTVRKLDDRLTGQATGQPQFVLEARGADLFEVPEVGARFTFLRGADGGVERLELKQGGQTLVGGKR